MRGIGFYFFGLGAICVTIGMCWGIQMAASGDHLMAPAHAHLNLVGWVTLALFGIYYTLTPAAAASGLARLHLAVAALGVVLLVPGIAIAIAEVTEAVAISGSFVTLASMLLFLFIIWRFGLGRPEQ